MSTVMPSVTPVTAQGIFPIRTAIWCACRNLDTYEYKGRICHMIGGNQRNRVLKLARRKQGVASRELSDHGIHRQTLTRLFVEGRIERVAPGLYRLPGQTVSENHGLALAAAAIPRGVICLLSALRYHGIGTQTPADIWMALDRRAWRPTLAYPPLRFVRFSG